MNELMSMSGTVRTTEAVAPAARPRGASTRAGGGRARLAGGVAAATVAVMAAVIAVALSLPGTAAAAPAMRPASTAAAGSGAAGSGDAWSTSRPGNGDVLTRRDAGDGVFTVDNAAGRDDAVVTLADDGRAVMAVYVRAGARATVEEIPDGTFDVYAEQGRGWNAAAGRFDVPGSSGQFDRRARFTTERTDDGVRYSVLTITLYAVPDGDVTLVPAPETAIPS